MEATGPSRKEARFSPLALEPVGGAVPLESKFYIERSADPAFLAAIKRRDSIVLIKGARQMGKTSLLARGLAQARQAGARVVLTDFQKLNSSALACSETFYRTLGYLIADGLDLEVLLDDRWDTRLSPSMNFERYFLDAVLDPKAAPVVWAMDEVDRLFTCPFASEIFALFRAWHNERSLDTGGPWSRLTLAISYATEAHLFITNINLSPFNVGARLTLEDFTQEQVAELNRRYGSPLKSREDLERFFRLVGGQPFLVRRSLQELATNPSSVSLFADRVEQDEGIFGDHLRRIVYLLTKNRGLLEIARGVLQGKTCPNWESFHRLQSGGVVTGQSATDVRPRCQLYARYLRRHLV